MFPPHPPCRGLSNSEYFSLQNIYIFFHYSKYSVEWSSFSFYPGMYLYNARGGPAPLWGERCPARRKLKVEVPVRGPGVGEGDSNLCNGDAFSTA